MLTIPFEGHAELLKQISCDPARERRHRYHRAFKPPALEAAPLAPLVSGSSAAQETAELVPKGITVVAAFHNTSAELLNADGAVDCDVIVCSDDPVASQQVQALAVKIPGVRAIDGGKLENAGFRADHADCLIGLNIRHKGHWEFASTPGLPVA